MDLSHNKFKLSSTCETPSILFHRQRNVWHHEEMWKKTKCVWYRIKPSVVHWLCPVPVAPVPNYSQIGGFGKSVWLQYCRWILLTEISPDCTFRICCQVPYIDLKGKLSLNIAEKKSKCNEIEHLKMSVLILIHVSDLEDAVCAPQLLIVKWLLLRFKLSTLTQVTVVVCLLIILGKTNTWW